MSTNGRVVPSHCVQNLSKPSIHHKHEDDYDSIKYPLRAPISCRDLLAYYERPLHETQCPLHERTPKHLIVLPRKEDGAALDRSVLTSTFSAPGVAITPGVETTAPVSEVVVKRPDASGAAGQCADAEISDVDCGVGFVYDL